MDELVISEYELVPFVMLQVHETEQCSQELARGRGTPHEEDGSTASYSGTILGIQNDILRSVQCQPVGRGRTGF
jgi:hypothetical protein